MDAILRWLGSYPYADAARGLRYLSHPDEPDTVPSVSMLPPPAELPRLAHAELDAEQQFVGSDGWFGAATGVVSFEAGPFLAEDERAGLLRSLLSESEEEVRGALLAAQKDVSPLRPTQPQYQHLAGREEGGCAWEWERVPGAYIAGLASGVSRTFSDLEGAQRACERLGAACRGVTCPGGGGGFGSCTVRRGDVRPLASPSGEESHLRHCGYTDAGADAPADCRWERSPGAYLAGYAAGAGRTLEALAKAQRECERLGEACRGVTCGGPRPGCTARRGDTLLPASPEGEESYLKHCVRAAAAADAAVDAAADAADAADADAAAVGRIVHVTFADGCCQASETGVLYVICYD